MTVRRVEWFSPDRPVNGTVHMRPEETAVAAVLPSRGATAAPNRVMDWLNRRSDGGKVAIGAVIGPPLGLALAVAFAPVPAPYTATAVAPPAVTSEATTVPVAPTLETPLKGGTAPRTTVAAPIVVRTPQPQPVRTVVQLAPPVTVTKAAEPTSTGVTDGPGGNTKGNEPDTDPSSGSGEVSVP